MQSGQTRSQSGLAEKTGAVDEDPTTRIMLEGILAQEEDHANDMHDLLVAHEGRPFLER